MTEEQRVNGPGIDTPYERWVLTYRPELKEIFGESKVTAPIIEDLQPETVIDEITEVIIPDIWEEIIKIEDKVDKVVDVFHEKLKPTIIPVNNETLHNLTGKDTLTIDDYKNALMEPTTHENSLIIKEIESHFGEIDGLMEGELYRDVLAIQDDVKDTKSFIEDGLIRPLMDWKTPNKSEQDEVVQTLAELEKKISDEYVLRTKEFESVQYENDKLVMTDYGSLEQQVKAKETKEAEKKKKEIETRLVTKTEIGALCKRKLGNLSYHIDYLEECVGFVPKEGEDSKIIRNLLSMFEKSKTLKPEHVLMGLRLGYDKRKEEVEMFTSNLRTISNRDNRLKVQDGLLDDIYLRNEVFRSLHEQMNEAPPTEQGSTEEWLFNNLTEGIYAMEDAYQQQSMDYFKMLDYEANYRHRHMRAVTAKESVRRLYSIVENMSGALEQSPVKEDHIDEWIDAVASATEKRGE